MEKENHFTKENFNNFIQFSPDGIVVIDSKTNIIQWNRTMEQYSGMQASELINTSFISFLHFFLFSEEDLQIFKQSIIGDYNFEQNNSLSIKGRIHFPDQPIYSIIASVFPVNDTNEKYFIISLRNLNEYREKINESIQAKKK